MITEEIVLGERLDSLYGHAPTDPGFDAVLREVPAATDAELADLIEADGRLRLRLGRTLTLERYLDATPDLVARTEPLDAAIDMALRSLARSRRADEQSVRALVDKHPRLGQLIRDAAALNNALWSTRCIHRQLAQSSVKDLPSDFGPSMDDGQRRYELKELLGEGAFGQIYLAVDRKFSEEDHPAFVAIKLLSGGDRTRSSRQRLIDEATKARRVNHPNVARVIDRGISGSNEDYLVYEFVDGGDLAKWARRRSGPVDARNAVRLVTRTAQGVHAAHMAGLVHCDLKPNNVVLTAAGEPKVVDFGVAIRAGDPDANRTQRDPLPVGNLAFMSPEQFRMDDGALTIPTDLYALGGILYWLLTAHLPNGSTPEEIRRTHDAAAGRRRSPSVRRHRTDVDKDLDAICRRAMAVRPADRFGSAAEFAENLEAWLRHEPIPWTRPSPLRRARLWIKRKPAAFLAMTAIAIVVAVSGSALWRMAAVARQERFETALAEARLEEEARMRNNHRKTMRGFIDRLRGLANDGIAYQVLPQILLAEWLFGPTLFPEGSERLELWELRTIVGRNRMEKSRARGGDRAFFTLLWESALAFWLIDDGEYDEAEPLIARNYAESAALLEPDDPWLVQLRAMMACVVVGRHPYGPMSPEDQRQLIAAAADLEEARCLLEDDEWGSPMHHLVLTHLATLYGHNHLDRAVDLETVEEDLREITD